MPHLKGSQLIMCRKFSGGGCDLPVMPLSVRRAYGSCCRAGSRGAGGWLWVVIVAVGMGGLLAVPAVGQNAPPVERPQPGSVQVVGPEEEVPAPGAAEPGAGGGEDEEAPKEPQAWLRVWLLSEPNAEAAYGAVLQPADVAGLDEGEFVWLYRGVQGFDFRDYQQISARAYRLVLVEEIPLEGHDEAALEAWSRRPPKEREVFRSAAFQLRKDQVLTLLLSREGGSWRLRELDEPEGRGKRLRVLSVVKEPVQAGLETPDGRMAPLWGGEKGTPELISLPQNAGETLVYAQFLNPRGVLLTRRHEVDFNQTPSVTLVVFPDRYGRITSRLMTNAPGS